ncbi:hypothetical protein [Dyadobacter bucti]|uniref:hypothetical protein n=1 Tax=Dyadobacter bucti TaxID=2572203 RepID=UPI00110A04A7|nr:hypothetical protein [Dyadobacter bucti]
MDTRFNYYPCDFMTGKELFDHYQSAAQRQGFGSREFHYGNILFQALKLEGEEKIFRLLEIAENTGKKIALAYSEPRSEELTDPDIAVLI